MFRVVEHQVRSKAGACLDDCEDGFLMTEDYACVIDGATSPTGKRWNNLTGGQWAKEILCRAVSNLSCDGMTAQRIVDYLTASIHQAYQDEPGALEVMSTCPEERATASLVIYSSMLRQVILVGDCQVAFVRDGKIAEHHEPKRYIDMVTSQARAMFWQAELVKNPVSESSLEDPGRDLIQPLLLRQRRFQNNPKAPELYRYWAMDGFPIDAEGFQVFNVPDSVQEIILASDGYPRLFPTLQETEAHLLQTVKEDPMMISKYPSTKAVHSGAESFDDRTYLRIRLQ